MQITNPVIAPAYFEHIAADGQRWDSVAFMYYGDALNFAPIIKANPGLALTTSLPAGAIVRVPVIEPKVPAQLLAPWLR